MVWKGKYSKINTKITKTVFGWFSFFVSTETELQKEWKGFIGGKHQRDRD